MNRKTIITIAIFTFCVALGVGLGVILSPSQAQGTYASIGYVDIERALEAHPDLDTVLQQIVDFENAKIEELSIYDDFESLTDDQREQFMNDLSRIQEESDAERQRLTEPLIQDVIDTTIAVGNESGIEYILEAGSMLYGGLDLTPIIISRLEGN